VNRVRVYAAQPVREGEGAQALIDIIERLPEGGSHERICEGDARALALVLRLSLPGATYRRLIAVMLMDIAGSLRVPDPRVVPDYEAAMVRLGILDARMASHSMTAERAMGDAQLAARRAAEAMGRAAKAEARVRAVEDRELLSFGIEVSNALGEGWETTRLALRSGEASVVRSTLISAMDPQVGLSLAWCERIKMVVRRCAICGERGGRDLPAGCTKCHAGAVSVLHFVSDPRAVYRVSVEPDCGSGGAREPWTTDRETFGLAGLARCPSCLARTDLANPGDLALLVSSELGDTWDDPVLYLASVRTHRLAGADLRERVIAVRLLAIQTRAAMNREVQDDVNACGDVAIEPKHTERCRADRAAHGQAMAEFESKHPRYCKSCGGVGSSVVSSMNREVQDDVNACGDCTGKGKCPRCSTPIDTEESKLTCGFCGWEDGDGGCPTFDCDCDVLNGESSGA